MYMQRVWLWAALMVVGLTLAPQAVPATNAWYGGGTHDGYDGARASGAPDYPRVHNAVGATNVTSTNAFLTGMLVATGGAPATVTVYWATEDGGKDTVEWESASDSGSHEFGEVALFDPLTWEIAVDSGKNYYYRFFVTNAIGQTGWALETAEFQTPAPPEISTGVGAIPGMTVASLNGELTAGVEAEIRIEWGEAADSVTEPSDLTTNYLGTITQAGTLDKPNPFSEKVTGLTEETTYAYRILAENDDGYIESDWVWFTTLPSPQDFTIVHGQSGWFGGGDYDGYSTIFGAAELSTDRGTMFYLR